MPSIKALDRREFLRIAAGGVALLFQAACQPSQLSPNGEPYPTSTPASPGTGSAPIVQAGVSTPDASLTPAKLDLPLPIQTTPIEHFYVTNYSDVVPGFDPQTWALGLDGLVAQALKFKFDEIRALPAVEVMRTLECIGNPVGGSLISNGTWKGVSLKELLNKAGVKPTAKYLIIEGTDDYFTSVPLELGLTDDALLAYELNGQPLTPIHGKPLRVLLPGLYGQKQPKWITHIEVADHYEKGPWEKKGWSDAAVIRPNTRIDRPQDDNVIAGRPGDVFTITGVAFTSTPGVARVEVSTDDGATWSNATLTRAPAPFTDLVWTRWGFDWQLPASGKYTLLARVIDNAGTGQGKPSFRFFTDAFPDGSDAIPMIEVQVRTD